MSAQARQDLMKHERHCCYTIPKKTLGRITLDPVGLPAAWTTKPSVVVIFELAARAASGSVQKPKTSSEKDPMGNCVCV